MGKWPSIILSLVITSLTLVLFQNCSSDNLDIGQGEGATTRATCPELGGNQLSGACQIPALTPGGHEIWSDHRKAIGTPQGSFALMLSGTESAEALCKARFGESSALVGFTDDDLGEDESAYWTYASNRLVADALAIPGANTEKESIIAGGGEYVAVDSPSGACNPCMLLTTVTCSN